MSGAYICMLQKSIVLVHLVIVMIKEQTKNHLLFRRRTVADATSARPARSRRKLLPDRAASATWQSFATPNKCYPQ